MKDDSNPFANWRETMIILEEERRENEARTALLQDQVRQLSIRLNHQREGGEDSDDASDVTLRPRRPNPRPSNDIKVDIPDYDGKLDPDEFFEWIRTIERVFDYKQVQKIRRLSL